MSIYRGAGGAGDAVADSASEALLIRDLVAEAEVDAAAAAASATAAAGSASTASTAATNASNSATAASTSATNAAASAATATTQASNASTSATAAQTAETAAELAETNAETAETNAASSASAASTSASNAATSSTNASNSASSASTSATNAANSATSAATSATNAANSATLAASYTPSQTGNAGKFLTTDGTATSWGNVSGSISVTGGDLTLSGSTGTAITNATLATVNSNVGSFGSSSSIPVVTVNAKGLITAVTTATASAPAAGSNTQIQYNSSGSFAGSSNLTFDGTNLSFNSGYGSAAVAYGCRAWVNFNGTGTVAIRGSGNVSSITDNGTGQYTINFSTSMPDANFAANSTVDDNGVACMSVFTTSSVKAITRVIQTGSFPTGAATDYSIVSVSIFR